MKIYLCVDFEGMPGVNHWDEVSRSSGAQYEEFRRIVSWYTVGACEAALSGGATEVWVADSHSSCCNIDIGVLPKGVKLVRGAECCDIQGMTPLLDKTFDGIAFLGFHSEQGSDANPLSHTLTLEIDQIKINDSVVGEYEIHSLFANYLGVPTIFVAGDDGLVTKVSKTSSAQTVSLLKGLGKATILEKTLAEYREEVIDKMKLAVESIKNKNPRPTVTPFAKGGIALEIKYKKHTDAYKASFYPNTNKLDPKTVSVTCANYMEVMRAILFLL